jgi:flagellar biosynthesis GTPase FlhF
MVQGKGDLQVIIAWFKDAQTVKGWKLKAGRFFASMRIIVQAQKDKAIAIQQNAQIFLDERLEEWAKFNPLKAKEDLRSLHKLPTVNELKRQLGIAKATLRELEEKRARDKREVSMIAINKASKKVEELQDALLKQEEAKRKAKAKKVFKDIQLRWQKERNRDSPSTIDRAILSRLEEIIQLTQLVNACKTLLGPESPYALKKGSTQYLGRPFPEENVDHGLWLNYEWDDINNVPLYWNPTNDGKATHNSIYKSIVPHPEDPDIQSTEYEVTMAITRIKWLEGAVEALENVTDLVGLTEVKGSLANLVRTLIVGPSIEHFRNMMLLGEAGTGKTQTASLLPDVFYRLGYAPLHKEFILTTKTQWVAPFEGQTVYQARMTYLTNVIGRVGFIDEAYTMITDPERPGYGGEALGQIVSDLDYYRGIGILIIGGYKEAIDEKLIAVQSGLSRRFPIIWNLPPYDPEELWKIFTMKAASEGFEIIADVNYILELITGINTKDGFKNLNAGVVGRMTELAKQSLAMEIFDADEFSRTFHTRHIRDALVTLANDVDIILYTDTPEEQWVEKFVDLSNVVGQTPQTPRGFVKRKSTRRKRQ